MNALHLIIIACLFVPVSGSGDAVKIPGPEGKRCFCYPERVVPAVWKGPPIREKQVVRV